MTILLYFARFLQEFFMWSEVLEGLIESLIALPILLVIYILIEFMEHKGGVKFEKAVAKSKKLGPLWASGLGIIPQCGFSAIMADLFSRRMITIGTLFAVFVATSDEAIPLMISNPKHIGSLAILLVSKFVLAVIVGYVADLIVRQKNLKKDDLEHTTHFEHEHTHDHSKQDDDHCETCAVEQKNCETCAHDQLHHHHELEKETEQTKEKVFWHIVWQGTKHTLEIFAWILGINLLIPIILGLAGGEEILQSIIGTNQWYQPLVTALLGLIPNCAGSVALVNLYMDGLISFSSCLGGLCTGAGLGLVILFKNNKNIKTNLFILLALFLIGATIGFVFNLFMPFSIVI